MDSGVVCGCCGHRISIKSLPECDYCGYLNVGTLDGTAADLDGAARHRAGVLKKLKHISVLSYRYKWDEEKLEYAQQSREAVKIADGEACDGKVVWSAQPFGQNPDSPEPLVLEVEYQYDGQNRRIPYPIKPVRGEAFWNVGVEVDAHLKLALHLGDQKRIARGGEIAFVNPRLQGPDEFLVWGPRRALYARDQDIARPVFNSVVNHPGTGDERYFVRIAEKAAQGVKNYQSDILLEAGRQYEVYIAWHNDAKGIYNERAWRFQGAARDVRLASSFPPTLAAGERGLVSGTFFSSNAAPPAVWSGARVSAGEAVKLAYVAGSARIHTQWGKNGCVLSTSLFSDLGTFIGLNELNGVIPGGDIYSGCVTYTIQTAAAT